jgi:palmitoyltransferase
MHHGANAYAKNRQEINMLHVAAQGDQPISIMFFMRHGIGINSGDKKSSAPIHWASFAGAELALSYLLAWGADVNA